MKLKFIVDKRSLTFPSNNLCGQCNVISFRRFHVYLPDFPIIGFFFPGGVHSQDAGAGLSQIDLESCE